MALIPDRAPPGIRRPAKRILWGTHSKQEDGQTQA
jgi:hypothetical protein